MGKLVNGKGAALQAFTAAVLERIPAPADVDELYRDVSAWYQGYHLLVRGSMPDEGWGPSRLDAIAIIINQVTGLDIGPRSNNYMIPENIQKRTAPVRYPFIWNATLQKRTQWSGVGSNGNDVMALARNLIELYGVFGQFHAQPDPTRLAKIDYTSDNSVNIEGLMQLEDFVKKIGPPKFQWSVDANRVQQGKEIYNWSLAQGSDCHGKRLVKGNLMMYDTWDTPVQDVGTDSRQYALLGRTARSGVLEGTKLFPFKGKPLAATDKALVIVAQTVKATVLQRLGTILRLELQGDEGSHADSLSADTPHARVDLIDMTTAPTMTGKFAYEARVLEGIWAAAPYLHNGSVPTLADLLEPASKRPISFQIGPKYDPNDKIGLAGDQTKFPNFTLQTGCPSKMENGRAVSVRSSGNSNCGHEYGVNLKPEEKKALLEYLKTL